MSRTWGDSSDFLLEIRAAEQGQTGDEPLGESQSQVVADGVDECLGCAVVGAVDGDGVVAAVGDLDEPGSAVLAGLRSGRGGEVVCVTAVRIGDGVVADFLAVQDRP